MTPAAIAARNRSRVLMAFAAVYILWGSTYLFIHYAVETIPPFFMGSTRLLIAGLVLYVFARWRGAPAPSASEWKTSAISGTLMLGIGNGSVVWASQLVPSGIVALIIAGVPVWMVVADWFGTGARPRTPILMGLALGLAGIAILVGPRMSSAQTNVNPVGAIVLVLGSMSWAAGSLMTRHRERPRSALVSISIQMIVAGILFTIVMLGTGELKKFVPENVTALAMISWLYLVVFGSWIGYSAYVYLLGAVSPAKAATYAYVNPVIAVVLGWAFAHETVGLRTGIAAAVILAGVAIITTAGSSGHTGEHEIPVVEEKAA
jgi:drug/metabolite transporter (DMT)-like permease